MPRIILDESRVTVVFPKDLYNWLEAVANKEDRPIANMVRFAVKRYLETYHEADRPPFDSFFK